MADTAETSEQADKTAVAEAQSEYDSPEGDDTVPPADDTVTDQTEPQGSDSTEGDDSPKFDQDLLDRAEDIGIPEDEREALGPEGLKRVLDAFAKHTTEQSEKPNKPTTDSAPSIEKFKIELDPELYDKEVVATLTALNDHYHKHLEAIAGANEKFAAEQREALKSQRVEGYFEALGKEWSEYASKPRNRQKIMSDMEVLEAGYKATGKKVPPEKTLFDRALRSASGDYQTTIAHKQIGDKLRKQNGQFSRRPTPRQNVETDPEKRAAAALQEKFGMDRTAPEFADEGEYA